MTTGGPDFTSGDDYVAARLSIDIPEGAAESIREITQEVERYRTTLEAAARAEADVNRYLEQMTEASAQAASAQQGLVAQLQSYLSLIGRSGLSGIQPSSGVPSGPAMAPFGGTSGMSPYATGGLGSPSGERPPNPSDVASQLNTAQTNNPREWLNMQHARGGVTAQDVINISPQSIQQLADKIADRERQGREQDLHTKGVIAPDRPEEESKQILGGVPQRIKRASSMAGQVINEISGGSTLGLGKLMARGLSGRGSRHRSAAAPSTSQVPTDTDQLALPGMEHLGGEEDTSTEEGTMGLSRITKMIPVIGGVLTSILGVFGTVQKGGEMVQGWRNMTALRGGAGGEGAQVELKARIMAMNPFITMDQARQIYQAVMSEGYSDASGAGADNVIDFMQKNLTSMNISVAESTKMLRATIVGSGKGDEQSVAGAVQLLRQELDAIRTLSRQSKLSTPDYVKGVEQMQGNLMSAGASPESAAANATAAMEFGSQDQATKGAFAQGTQDLSKGLRAGAMFRAFGGPGGSPMMNLPVGLMPNVIPAWLAAQGDDVLYNAQVNVMTHFAKLAAAGDAGDQISHLNAIGRFQLMLQQVMPDHPGANDLTQAGAFYSQLLGGEGPAAAARARAQFPAPGPGSFPAPLRAPGPQFQPAAPLNMPAPSPDTGDNPRGPAFNPAPGGVQQQPPQRSAPAPAATTNVQIGLTPEAAKLLTVIGPKNTAQLPPDKEYANRGWGGYQVNGGRR